MLVSIIIPSFNARSTIQDCIESALRQTLPDREIIVVDGGSTDGTMDVVRGFAPGLVAWSSEPDNGIYDAANKGVRRARGDWVYFLGADDVFSDDTVLERMADLLQGTPENIRVIYGRVAMLGGPWPETRKRLVSYMSLPHQGIFHRRTLFREHGEFDPSYRVGGDYEFLLRELNNRDAIFAGDVTVAACRTGGRSGRASGHIRLLREWRRAQRAHGLRIPTIRWSIALWGAFLQAFLYIALGQKNGARLFDFVRGIFGRPPYWSRIR